MASGSQIIKTALPPKRGYQPSISSSNLNTRVAGSRIRWLHGDPVALYKVCLRKYSENLVEDVNLLLNATVTGVIAETKKLMSEAEAKRLKKKKKTPPNYPKFTLIHKVTRPE